MTITRYLRRLAFGASVAVGSVVLATSAWSQAPPDVPPIPDPPKADVPKDPPKADIPKDAPKVPPKSEVPKDPPRADVPKDVPRELPKVEPPPKDPPKTDVPKDAPKDLPKADVPPKDLPKDPKEPARDVPKDARDAARDARDAARDLPRDARDAVRDAPRDARDAARDTRDAVRDAPRDARDAVRDTRDAVRDVPRDARDAVRDTRDAVRDTRANVRIDTLRASDLGVTFGPARNGWFAVSALAPTTPLGRIGLRTGDYILSVNGQRVAQDVDFVRFLLAEEVRGTRVPIVIWRDGRQTTIYAEPTMLLEGIQTTQHRGGHAHFGVVLDKRYPDDVIVQSVTSGSPAHAAGIRAGDMLTAIDGERLRGTDDFEAIIAAGGRSAMRVDLVRSVDVNLNRATSAVPHTTLRPTYEGTVMPAQPTYTQPMPVYRDNNYNNRDNARRGYRGGRR